ncbi:hypothetical protein [Methylobacterium brachythecii]|uniref:hypothetical protein n=1 Tax=Methylobacterium brachythecii TaxID=1176177 RepID=UPI00161B2AC8|nr:hypothetical protein [Methylobacterium brachythecii]
MFKTSRAGRHGGHVFSKRSIVEMRFVTTIGPTAGMETQSQPFLDKMSLNGHVAVRRADQRSPISTTSGKA